MTTEKKDLSRTILRELGNLPHELKSQGYALTVGQVALNLGNLCLALCHDLERGEPQIYQPVGDKPETLYALGKQLREIGLLLWEPEKSKERVSIEREIDQLKVRLFQLEKKGGLK